MSNPNSIPELEHCLERVDGGRRLIAADTKRRNDRELWDWPSFHRRANHELNGDLVRSRQGTILFSRSLAPSVQPQAA